MTYKEIKQTLKEIGLTEGEIQVYLALIELGSSTTGRIAKLSNISNSKVYEVLQRLTHKGLASYVIERGTRHFMATPPQRLIDFLDTKQAEIEKGKQKLRKLIPEFESKRKRKEIPEAVIYRGRQGPIIALKEILEAHRKGHPSYGYGTQDYAEQFLGELDSYVQEAVKLKAKSKLILPIGYKTPNTFAQIRYIPEEFNIPVRVMIYENKVALVDFSEPMTTIIIEKKEIAESFLNHFTILWKSARKR